jgi:hypothetical protein
MARGDHLYKHGLRYHFLYTRWLSIKGRCTNPKHERYADYGGRGITLCDRWHEFPNFLEDMGEPLPKQSIERIDNDKGYCKENCIWTDSNTQMRNTRRNRKLEFNGKVLCVNDWAKELGINESSLRERLEKWPLEKALTQPKRKLNDIYKNAN